MLETKASEHAAYQLSTRFIKLLLKFSFFLPINHIKDPDHQKYVMFLTHSSTPSNFFITFGGQTDVAFGLLNYVELNYEKSAQAKLPKRGEEELHFLVTK